MASGQSVVEVARLTGVSESSIGRCKRKTGVGESLEPGVSPGGPRKITGDEEETLRAQWRTAMTTVDAGTVVFLDEISTRTTLTRSRGRVPRGERVVGAVPRDHEANITCLVAMRPSGMQAPCGLKLPQPDQQPS